MHHIILAPNTVSGCFVDWSYKRALLMMSPGYPMKSWIFRATSLALSRSSRALYTSASNAAIRSLSSSVSLRRTFPSSTLVLRSLFSFRRQSTRACKLVKSWGFGSVWICSRRCRGSMSRWRLIDSKVHSRIKY